LIDLFVADQAFHGWSPYCVRSGFVKKNSSRFLVVVSVFEARRVKLFATPRRARTGSQNFLKKECLFFAILRTKVSVSIRHLMFAVVNVFGLPESLL